MNEEKRYPISEELHNAIIPVLKYLDSLAVSIDTLGGVFNQSEKRLWRIIHTEYPELQGKSLKIDEVNKKITIVQAPETPIIETLPEGEFHER